MKVYNSRLYFRADDGTIGRELWTTDGDSVWLVKDIYADRAFSGNPSGLTLI